MLAGLRCFTVRVSFLYILLITGDDSIHRVTDPGNVLVFILIWCFLRNGEVEGGDGDGGAEREDKILSFFKI